MTSELGEGVVSLLAALAERAAALPDGLGAVGAGPHGDLVSHSGNGALVVEEVEEVAGLIRASGPRSPTYGWATMLNQKSGYDWSRWVDAT